ncbi:MAG TPA: dihydroorotate dehydrogenase electron transfer subunit [Candidatus Omnitrophota bacterium]|nr:dihydroorotate dehydrogenase electron transfer subunit [Candidatus Omnitrophota bacterium]
MAKIQGVYKIIANQKLSSKFFKLSIEAKSFRGKIQPGQFVHVKINDRLDPFFRRPFCIHRVKRNLEILYEVVGRGTEELSQKKKSEHLNILGPLGNGFTLPSRNIQQVVMIAGGIGVAPFLALTDILRKRKIRLVLLYGGRTKEYVFNMKAFKDNGCQIFISTDDGSYGVKGRVSGLFKKIRLDKSTYFYACGPKPMIKTVQEFSKENNIEGQASLEEIMACGVGTCLGCSIKTRQGYKTVCHDGPVFDLKDIVFEK